MPRQILCSGAFGVASAYQSGGKPSQTLLGGPGLVNGAPFIERFDLLVKLISHDAPNAEIDRTVQIVDQKLSERIVEGGSGTR
jgi:hypothetical protein